MGHFLRNLIGQIIDFMDYIIIGNIIQAPGHSVSSKVGHFLAHATTHISSQHRVPQSLNCVSNTSIQSNSGHWTVSVSFGMAYLVLSGSFLIKSGTVACEKS